MTRIIVLALIALASAAACTSRSDAVVTDDVQPVGRTFRRYVDEGRSAWSGAGARPLTALIWYPATAGTVESEWFLGPPANPLFRVGRSAENAPVASSEMARPLVLLSHGTGGSGEMLAWLGEALARAGYVVAAVNHHGNTSAEPVSTPEGFMLWWERATDLSRLLDRLTADPQFAASIDWNRIGAAGFSLGGYTALAVAGSRTSLERWRSFCESAGRDSTCTAQPEFPEALVEFEKIRDRADIRHSIARHGDSYHDARFRAVFAIAPVGSWLTEEGLRAVDVPVRVIVGAHDTTAPAINNATRIAQLIPGAHLSVLEGVGHYTFLAACESAGVRNRPDLCREEPGVDRVEVHRRVAAEAVTFFGDIFGMQ